MPIERQRMVLQLKAVLLGDLVLQVAALARLLDVEADAVAREAAARLRAAVDEVVGIAIAEGVAPTELDAAVRRRPWPTREPG
jgi:hypothetical protein